VRKVRRYRIPYIDVETGTITITAKNKTEFLKKLKSGICSHLTEHTDMKKTFYDEDNIVVIMK